MTTAFWRNPRSAGLLFLTSLLRVTSESCTFVPQTAERLARPSPDGNAPAQASLPEGQS